MVDLIDKILKVFTDNNLFDEGIELIGSWCFKLYQKHLGIENFPLRTLDIDFLIPRTYPDIDRREGGSFTRAEARSKDDGVVIALLRGRTTQPQAEEMTLLPTSNIRIGSNPFHGKEHANFIKQLEVLGFDLDFKSDGSLYLWNAELKIEFITVEKGKGTNKAIKINKLGVNAIPLRHVGLLLDKPVVINDSGKNIRVPAPSRFCLHKLVIASRRKKLDKSLKDLQQAIYTSTIVDEKEMQELFRTLPKKWRQSILKMLGKAKVEFPSMGAETDKLSLTLQNSQK